MHSKSIKELQWSCEKGTLLPRTRPKPHLLKYVFMVFTIEFTLYRVLINNITHFYNTGIVTCTMMSGLSVFSLKLYFYLLVLHHVSQFICVLVLHFLHHHIFVSSATVLVASSTDKHQIAYL
jgi:hypothetical protein